MDVFLSNTLLSCAVVALLLLYGWKILNWLWFRPRYLEKRLRQQGFNGNSYRLLYGDLKEISVWSKEAKSKPMNFSHDIVYRAIPTFHKALQNYGEKCFLWFGPTPAVLMSDPEIIREVMSKNYVFQKPPSSPFSRLLAGGLASLDTDKWAKHRKLINPAFHLEKLKHMVPSFYLSCADMLSKWDEAVASGGSCELDVWPHLQTMTSDVISRTAFGSSYEEGRKIFQLQKEQAEQIMESNRSIHIPGYRFLPTGFNRKMKAAAKEIESTLLTIINKRMKAMEEAGDQASMNEDLLGLLLESNLKEIKQHGNESGMSMKEVIEECKLFYFAGQETTASLLVWTMILLSKHEGWQARARDEVMQAFGTEKPDYQELNQLKTVSMIFHEVMRLYPPAVLLSRAFHEECWLGKKVSLPAGVLLMISPILVHHDCRLWGDDAMEFNPERFSEGMSKATQGQLAYFPFGWGPRICIGQNFAMLEAKMAMAMILQRYSFELSPSYSHAPQKVITLQPQYGAHLTITKLR